VKTILVPTDFSPNATKALDFAVQIAKQASAKIIIIHACDLLNVVFKDHIKMKEEYNQKIIDEATATLKILKKSIEETEQLAVETQLYKGLVQDTILFAAGEYRADMIVLGTLGNSGAKEKLFGSKTSGIIGKANVPVLAVPLLSEWIIPSTILLAVNNFEQDAAVTKMVFELAGLFGATVQIILFTDDIFTSTSDYLQQGQDIRSCQEKFMNSYKDITIKATQLDGYKFQQTLDNYIKEKNVDMLAMVTHRRNFLENIFNRSMTRKMSYHTRIPLLALPE
jgi:nucleotide-binding universal stress UspA family protein